MAAWLKRDKYIKFNQKMCVLKEENELQGTLHSDNVKSETLVNQV